MKFGLFMMPKHHPSENPTLAFERDLELIQFCEWLGFDDVWVGEHHSGGWETVPAPDIFISAAAQRTKRIRLGTGVTSLPLHHPFHVAERMAFLDHLTHGRTMLGVGPGVLPSDAKLFGIEPDDLRPMTAEALEIITRLYQEEGPVTYEGKYWTIKEMELQIKCYQKPHIPLAIASGGSGFSLNLIGKYGLQLLSGHLHMAQSGIDLGKQWEKVEDSVKTYGGVANREDWQIAMYVYVGDSTEEAIADIKEKDERELTNYTLKTGYPWPGRRLIVGDPDECTRQIKKLEEETGGFGGFLMIPVEWTSREKWNHNLELFARFVMPQFQGSLKGVQRSYQRMVDDNAKGTLPTASVGHLKPPVK